jgi:hypothetical protein
MPATYLFNIKRERAGFEYRLIGSCAIVGNTAGDKGFIRTFASINDLEVALDIAGIDVNRYRAAIISIRSGYNSFFEISRDEAILLKILVGRADK